MRRRRASPGFSLIELIIACSLSTIVIIGVMELMSSMVMTEVDGMRQGTITSWALANINAMNADISAAAYLSRPVAGATDTTLIVCTNWAANALGAGVPGVVSPGAKVLMTPPATYAVDAVYYYCYDTADGPPFKNSILRKVVYNPWPAQTVCPLPGTAAPACTIGNYPNSDALVATGVYQVDYPANTVPIFTGDSAVPNGVRLQFRVGLPVAGVSAGRNGPTYTTNAAPMSMKFDTKIVLEAVGN